MLTDDLLAPAAKLIVDDVSFVEAAIAGMRVTRLDQGRDETELTLVDLGTVGLCVGRFDFNVSSEADFPEDFRLGLQLDEGAGSWNGKAFDLDRLWVYGPGSEHAGAAAPREDGRGVTWVTFTVPTESMAAIMESDFVDRRGLQTTVQADLGSLQATLRDVVASVEHGTFTVEQGRLVERDLCERAAALLSTSSDATTDERSSYRITRQCVAAADDLDPIPTTAELASALGVSDRWVRAAFVQAYGVSVSEFFRARALHRARRALAAADPRSTTVTEIAMLCGFWHLGRFSGYYRAHFGELPRQTLHRRF